MRGLCKMGDGTKRRVTLVGDASPDLDVRQHWAGSGDAGSGLRRARPAALDLGFFN